RKPLEYEKAIAEWWKKNKTFEKSIENRPETDAYVFYDGPPFITGNPHHGTLLSSIVKDCIPRYQTMRGKRVERRWGWDCHGLPAENFVEKQLGIEDRRQIGATEPIEKDGKTLPPIKLEDYITKARESMVANSETWESTIDRVGRWVDFKGAYKTMDKDFMESVWWAFKELYDKGKIYEGEKVLMYDTKFATPVSKNEVTMDNDAYQTVTDPSVYVKFKLTNEDKYLLAWTTTPWTLPANTALAVNPKLKYVELELNDSKKVFIVTGKYAFGAETGIKEIAENLTEQGYDVTVIHHQNPAAPQYEEELKALEKYDFSNANIITHSLGAPTFLSFLARNDLKINSISMIAPAYPGRNVGSTNPEWLKTSGYVGYELDFNDIKAKIKQTPVIIYSDNDEPGRCENVEDLGEILGAKMILEPSKKHFFGPDYSFVPDYEFRYKTNLILAKKLVETVLVDEKHTVLDYKILREFSGADLVGLEYEGLFDGGGKVWAGDFVEDEGGTGIVHIAPAYGEDDFALAQANNIPVLHAIDDNGYYLPEFAEELRKIGVQDTDETGIEVWAANKFIAKCLQEQGIVWKIDYIQHEYPFNPRSKQRIMYRAIPSWFFDIQGSKPLMLEQNENVNWFPTHLKHGRFAKNIDQAPDWNLSRDRFWATAMPVWKGDKGSVKVVGSYAELEKLSGVKLDDYHRPWVDEIEFDLGGEHFTRIEKVLDCWFESGSMPFAQFHYPFENKEKFEANFPGDFIAEYMPQVRAWFYYVHTIGTALFGENPFKNVIVEGTLAGNDGRKMSKSLGNFTDPNELMDKFSADALRFLLLSSPLLSGEDFALIDKDVSDVQRKLSMIWNVYDFLTMYAEVDGWEFTGEFADLKNLKNTLDIWIMSRLHQLKAHITKNMDAYNIPAAMEEILPFIDDLSNWFVRRSRRRFWKSEDDSDKNDAYATLHCVLSKLAVLLAPFTPFLAEELWQKMVGEGSVHLLDWPTNVTVDEKVLSDMARAREIIEKGLALRMSRDDEFGQIKVRQPLASLTYGGEKLDEFYEQIIADEVNVKKVILKQIQDDNSVVCDDSIVTLDKKLTSELKQEGFVRELIRYIQNARKNAGLNVDDRIKLAIIDAPEFVQSFAELIKTETLATEITTGNYAYDEIVKIDDTEITISLEK
ncbi:class I tRNA ligase family protein, partial [Candidatus Saccharibacteria bacterium]|nr:class I tRNA ligase family protein [Candidatus Saccharibacteria bacterium]